MTTQEFYNEFNLLYNNIMSNKSPGLDEYEVSVFLTHAQEELVIAMYKGMDYTGTSFEGTEESRRYLANLIKNAVPTVDNTYTGLLSSNSKAYNIPSDVLFITDEYATISSSDCNNGETITILPVKQDEYYKISNNPFRQANERRALRLDLTSTKVELISTYTITYKIRYIAKPEPIILTNLASEGVSINGSTAESTCKLDPSLHRLIIKSAVELAVAAMVKSV